MVCRTREGGCARETITGWREHHPPRVPLLLLLFADGGKRHKIGRESRRLWPLARGGIRRRQRTRRERRNYEERRKTDSVEGLHSRGECSCCRPTAHRQPAKLTRLPSVLRLYTKNGPVGGQRGKMVQTTQKINLFSWSRSNKYTFY